MLLIKYQLVISSVFFAIIFQLVETPKGIETKPTKGIRSEGTFLQNRFVSKINNIRVDEDRE